MSFPKNVYNKSRNCIALQVYSFIFVVRNFGYNFVNTKFSVQNCIATTFEPTDNTEALTERLKLFFFPIVNKVPDQSCPLPLKNLLKKSLFTLQVFSALILFGSVQRCRMRPYIGLYGLFLLPKPLLKI